MQYSDRETYNRGCGEDNEDTFIILFCALSIIIFVLISMKFSASLHLPCRLFLYYRIKNEFSALQNRKLFQEVFQFLEKLKRFGTDGDLEYLLYAYLVQKGIRYLPFSLVHNVLPEAVKLSEDATFV